MQGFPKFLFALLLPSLSFGEFIVFQGTVTSVSAPENYSYLNQYLGTQVNYVFYLDFSRPGEYIMEDGVHRNPDTYNVYDDVVLRPDFFPEPGFNPAYDGIIEGHMGSHRIGPMGFYEWYDLNSRHEGRYTNIGIESISEIAFEGPWVLNNGSFGEYAFDANGAEITMVGTISSYYVTNTSPVVPEPPGWALIGLGMVVVGCMTKGIRNKPIGQSD